MKRIDFNKAANKESYQRFTLPLAFTADQESLNVTGYAAVWDVFSTDRGGFLAVFPKGSMVLPKYDVTLQYNHNADYILARESNGTLEIGEDEVGVTMSATLTDATFERDLLKRIGNKLVNGMSLGMYPIQTHRERKLFTADDLPPNSGLEDFVGKEVMVEFYDQWLLDEVTVTALPAFTQTSIERFQKGERETAEELEEIEVLSWRLRLQELL